MLRCWFPILIVMTAVSASRAEETIPEAVQAWLTPQHWQRDTEGPVISLGEQGSFDDTHLFAPSVALEDGEYRLWYCGSRGAVKERVFKLGLATSADGRHFQKHPDSPVYEFGDKEHSILTPTLLRSGDGNVLREDGKLRMWFATTHFAGKSGLHTLHETSSENGLSWEAPSESLLDHVYAPTILKDGDRYRMWYTDVSAEPWLFRHAASSDGRTWEVTEEPVMQIDQEWEQGRLFYPTVLKIDGVYLMWYGSYWKGHPNHTALGFAASQDGLTWHKSPHNPAVKPQADRPWESHYTTSQSVMRLPDGSFRIWYASRTKPPHVNKYFAVGTARWER